MGFDDIEKDVDDVEGSVDQKAWTQIGREVRNKLSSRVPEMGQMSVCELSIFVQTLQMARWLNVHAQCFDKEVEIEQARLPFGN